MVNFVRKKVGTPDEAMAPVVDKRRPMTEQDFAPWGRLSAAIVEQAAKDFINVRNEGDVTAARGIARFFHSDWYKWLCHIPPGKILKNLPTKQPRKSKLIIEVDPILS